MSERIYINRYLNSSVGNGRVGFNGSRFDLSASRSEKKRLLKPVIVQLGYEIKEIGLMI